MRRIHAIEIAEQPWCPRVVREALTDYLETAIVVGDAYGTAAPLLADALDAAGTTDVVDLCAGGGGPWRALVPALGRAGYPVRVRLTDLFPNGRAFERIASETGGAATGCPEPVDARRVPPGLGGVRTLFSAFHHFRPDDARAVLRDAAESGRAIAVFEATRRDARTIAITLLVPLLVFLLTPKVRPFRWSRLLLTYLLPVVPLVALFDGIVSCLRTYTVAELRALVADLDVAGYEWRVGEAGTGPIPMTWLVGAPRRMR